MMVVIERFHSTTVLTHYTKGVSESHKKSGTFSSYWSQASLAAMISELDASWCGLVIRIACLAGPKLAKPCSS